MRKLKIRHGRVARQREPATQNLSKPCFTAHTLELEAVHPMTCSQEFLGGRFALPRDAAKTTQICIVIPDAVQHVVMHCWSGTHSG
jgi:hypothetical protein